MWLYIGLGFVAAFVLGVFVNPFAGVLAVLAFLLFGEPDNRAEMTAGALLGMAAAFGYHMAVGSLAGAAAPRLGP
jgi:hypothetical protein